MEADDASYECISRNARELTKDEFIVSYDQDEVGVESGKTADVTATLTLTDAGKEALFAFINGTYLNGFFMLEAQDEDGIDLSVSYLGFYGDWGASPVFDKSLYDDEEASAFPGYFTADNGDEDAEAIILGTNQFDPDIVADADKIVVYGRPDDDVYAGKWK